MGRTPLSKLGATSAVAVYLLIVLGGVVRATGSGLGCPDWPTCHGSWIPPVERAALIEYSHRTLAAFVGVLVVIVVIASWRERHRDPRSWLLSLAALGLLLVQAWLGRQVVLTELSAPLVGIHLGTAMVLLAVLVLIALPQARLQAQPGRAAWLVGAAGGVLAVIVVGAWVRGSGAGLAFGDWPLMDGAVIPGSLSDPARLVHFLHRLVALTVGIYLLVLWLGIRRRSDLAAQFAGLTFGFYALQAAIGASLVWTGLTPWSVVAHVALAALTWVLAFRLAFSGYRESRTLVEATAAEPI